MKPEDHFVRFSSRMQSGHVHDSSDSFADRRWTAKKDSHDDGERCGLFLGGIGAPVCSRNIDGMFDRWHLQTGYHVNQAIESAFFGVAWRFGDEDETSGYARLAATGPHAYIDETHQCSRIVYSLFPVIHERYSARELPFEIVLELFSPLIGSDESIGDDVKIDPAGLPVFFATIAIQNRSDIPIEIDTVLFWPNVLGWKTQRATVCDHSTRPWPGQTHAGNTARSVPTGAFAQSAAYHSHGVIQERSPHRPKVDEMEGQVAIISSGDSSDRTSSVSCLKAGTNKIDRPPSNQGWTVPWAEEQFALQHHLPDDGIEWTMHWDEAMASAVHRGAHVAPLSVRSFRYTIAVDIPIVRFGEERRWFRKYTCYFDTTGTNALQIAELADSHHDTWRDAVDAVHATALEDPALPAPIVATMFNELYFVNGGGTAWVQRWASELDQHMEPPLLGGWRARSDPRGFRRWILLLQHNGSLAVRVVRP
jgi:non-lysosomal glucosylceramidase